MEEETKIVFQDDDLAVATTKSAKGHMLVNVASAKRLTTMTFRYNEFVDLMDSLLYFNASDAMAEIRKQDAADRKKISKAAMVRIFTSRQN